MDPSMADLGDFYYSQVFNDSKNQILVKPKPKRLSLFSLGDSKSSVLANLGKQEAVNTKENDELYFALRFFLRFGRLLGIIPLTGLLGSTSEKLKFR
jgi:hypothetical protein